MNENDLRDCFAMFALCGLIMRGNSHPVVALPQEAYQYADAMLEARKPKDETGIVAVKRSSTKKEK